MNFVQPFLNREYTCLESDNKFGNSASAGLYSDTVNRTKMKWLGRDLLVRRDGNEEDDMKMEEWETDGSWK